MLTAVENEPVVESKTRGSWQYVCDTETKAQTYLHLDCDAVVGDDGRCLMCGAACPTIWNVN